MENGVFEEAEKMDVLLAAPGSGAKEQVKHVLSLCLWWYLHQDVMALPLDSTVWVPLCEVL